jgi:hypothetical protein
MADPPPYPDSDSDTGVGPDRGSTTGTPRWVKVFGIIFLIVVLLFFFELFTSGPHRGPGDHTPSGVSGGQTPPSSVIEDHAPPGGGHGWS